MIEILATDPDDPHLRPDEARFKALLDLESSAQSQAASESSLQAIGRVRVMAGVYATRLGAFLDLEA